MDSLTHLIHSIFDENGELTPEGFNDMTPQEQFKVFSLMRFEIRSRILPQSSGNTDRILKKIDSKLSDVLFG